jgi:hypothetical protein
MRFTQGLTFSQISSQIHAGDKQCGIIYSKAFRKAQNDGHHAPSVTQLLKVVRHNYKKQGLL